MDSWENDFSKRIAAIRDSFSKQFADLSGSEIAPAFNAVKSFVEAGGFTAAAQQGSSSVQSYRFSLSDDIFVDIQFTLVGPGAVRSSFRTCTPCSESHNDVIIETISLATLTEDWARQQFRTGLDSLIGEIEKMTVSEGGMAEQAQPAADPTTPVEGEQPAAQPAIEAATTQEATPPTPEAPAPEATAPAPEPEATPAPAPEVPPAAEGGTKEAA